MVSIHDLLVLSRLCDLDLAERDQYMGDHAFLALKNTNKINYARLYRKCTSQIIILYTKYEYRFHRD